MLRRSGIAMAALFLFASMAWAQDNTYEVSLGGSAVFSKQSTGNGTVLTPTNSGRSWSLDGTAFRHTVPSHSTIRTRQTHRFTPPRR